MPAPADATRCPACRRRPTGTTPLALAALALLLPACAAPAPDNPGLLPDTVELTFPADDYDRVYTATVNALTDLGFTLDRRDHRFGVVTTRPLRVGTFAEPWVATRSTLPQSLAATGAPRQRVVRVELVPTTAVEPGLASVPVYPEPPALAPGASFDRPSVLPGHPLPGSAYRLDITAAVEQLATPVRRPTRSMEAKRKIDDLTAVPAGVQRLGVTQPAYYHAVARDPALEQRLLDAIVARLDAS
ncbi:MAG: hypothetical protein AAF842_03895 [Planctomycetota bacterium]